MPQRARTFKVNCCLEVHNAYLELLSPISGYGNELTVPDLYLLLVHQLLCFSCLNVQSMALQQAQNSERGNPMCDLALLPFLL